MSEASSPGGGTPDEPLDGMFKRIFSDPDFATALERDPEQALREVGFDLDDEAREELRRIQEEGQSPDMEGLAVLPLVAVAVRVYTGPAVRVGTAPAVRVATRTQVPIRQQEQMAERLAQEDAEALRAREDEEKGTSEQ